MGGQTALNLCNGLDEKGVWEKYGVEIIGVDIDLLFILQKIEKDSGKLMEKIDIPVSQHKFNTSFF